MKKYTIVLSIALLAGVVVPGYAIHTPEHKVKSEYDSLTLGQKQAINKKVFLVLLSLKKQLSRFIKNEINQEKMSQGTYDELRNLKMKIAGLKKKYKEKLDGLEAQDNE